jgi:hypothetical protein
MEGKDGYVIGNQLYKLARDVVILGNSANRAKDERMMGNDEIEISADCVVNYLLGHVKRDKHALNLGG